MTNQITPEDIQQELESILAPYLCYFKYPDGTQIPACFVGRPPPETKYAEPGVEVIVNPIAEAP